MIEIRKGIFTGLFLASHNDVRIRFKQQLEGTDHAKTISEDGVNKPSSEAATSGTSNVTSKK